MRITRTRTAIAALMVAGLAALPLAGCGSDQASMASTAASTAAAEPISTAAVTLGAAAMSTLQEIKGEVAAGDLTALGNRLTAAKDTFTAALDSVKSAVANGSAQQAVKAKLSEVGTLASGALDAAIAAAEAGDTAAFTKAADDLQSALGSVLSSKG